MKIRYENTGEDPLPTKEEVKRQRKEQDKNLPEEDGQTEEGDK